MRRVVGEIKDIPQLGNTEGQMGAAARKLSLGREALQAPAAPVLGVVTLAAIRHTFLVSMQ